MKEAFRATVKRLLAEAVAAGTEVGVDHSVACGILLEEAEHMASPQFATILLDSDEVHSKLQAFKEEGVFVLAFRLPNIPVPKKYFVEGLLSEKAVFPVKTEQEYDAVVNNMETFIQRHIGVFPDMIQRKLLECHPGHQT